LDAVASTAADRIVIAEDRKRRATFRIQTARQAMVKPFPSKTHIGNHMLHPETLMLNYGYDPQLSEGAVKPPVFLTSTFVFRTAEDGQDFFDYVSGRREPPEGMGAGLVYSRFNHS
jgi:methionine-gamma-lyase